MGGAEVVQSRLSGLHQDRRSNPEFAAEWDAAILMSVADVDDELVFRGVEGWDEPVWYEGVQVGSVRKYSDPQFSLLPHVPEYWDGSAAVAGIMASVRATWLTWLWIQAYLFTATPPELPLEGSVPTEGQDFTLRPSPLPGPISGCSSLRFRRHLPPGLIHMVSFTRPAPG